MPTEPAKHNKPQNPSQNPAPRQVGRADQGGPSAPPQGQPQPTSHPTEIPGRPDVDTEPNRDKAYGPGGGKVIGESSNIDEPNPEPPSSAPGGRTAAGAD